MAVTAAHGNAGGAAGKEAAAREMSRAWQQPLAHTSSQLENGADEEDLT